MSCSLYHLDNQHAFSNSSHSAPWELWTSVMCFSNANPVPATIGTPKRPSKRVRSKSCAFVRNLFCSSCNTTTTPEWRTGPTGKKTLCNACGLKYAKKLQAEELEKNTIRKRMSIRKILNKVDVFPEARLDPEVSTQVNLNQEIK